MQPLYAIHRDATGAVLTAGSFDYHYKLQDWLRSLDVRAGDKIEFGEVVVRDEVAPAPVAEAV